MKEWNYSSTIPDLYIKKNGTIASLPPYAFLE
jgi:hypothetical protein